MSYDERFFFEIKLTKSLLRTQLKLTNLENRLPISTASPKEYFNDIVFKHFVHELKYYSLDMPMHLQLLVPVFSCLYSIYFVVMLPFRMNFFHNVFCFISFPRGFAISYSLVTCNF